MRRIRHWRGLLLAFTAFCTALLFLLYSETGLRLSVFLLTDVLIKPLTIKEFQGRLAGPLTLSGIEYVTPQRQLALEQLTLDWKPSRLLAATAHVTVLHARGLSVNQQQQETEAREPPEKLSLPQIGFPLKLIIDDARLDGMTIQRSTQAEPLTVTLLSLQAETSLNTLRLHTLRMDSDWLTFTVSGNIRPRQDYRIALDLEWTVPQKDRQPWQGHGTLQGNISNLKLQQQLTSPFAATLALEGDDLIDALAWKGRLDIPQLQSTQLPFSVSPPFTLGGELTANGDLDTFTATSHIAGQIDTVGAIETSVDATYRDRKIQLTSMLLTRKEDGARIELSGDIGVAAPLRYRLQAKWRDLAWPRDSRSFDSESGQLTVSGEDKHYQFDGDFLFGGAQLPPGAWQLRGHGNETVVTMDAVEGKLLDGTVSGNASLELTPRLRWQGQLQGKGLNPGIMWPRWPGSLEFVAGVNGRRTEKGVETAISLSSLNGALRGRKLQGHSEAGMSGSVAFLKDLEIQIGSAKLKAKGRRADELAFDWQLEAAELNDLFPQAKGSLEADGDITGPLQAPRFTLRANGGNLQFAAYQIGRIHADISLDLQQRAPSSLKVRAEELRLPGFPSQSLNLNGSGSIMDHRLTLNTQSARQSLSVGMAAGYTEGRWAGKLNRLQLDDTQLGQWQLAKATGFSIMAQGMHLDEFCLNKDGASLCSQGNWERDSRLSADLRSTRFPLELLQPYLPQRFAFAGELNGMANLVTTPQRPPRVRADLNVGPGQFVLVNPDTGDADFSLAHQGADMRIRTSVAGAVESELTLTLGEGEVIVLALQSSLARGWPKAPMRHPLKGRLTASLGELGFISSMIPDVQNFNGSLDVDVQLAGTLNSPRLSGYARLDEGRLDIPRMGLNLTAIHLAASGHNSKKMVLDGGARSGPGELVLSGQLAPTETGIWGLELSISGKEFEVARIPEARVLISPDLKARIIGREIRLEGEIDIPTARLEPPDISLAVRPSDDVIIVREEEEEIEQERWIIHTRIRMTAADTIRFIGYGFDGRVGGDLLLIDEPGSVTRARGQLHVVPGGTYASFGTKLSTERGRLNFADSPVDNPNLDIKASRTIGDVIAGINIRGTAKKPLLTLFSEPPMDQADILSYLTLGHPMSTAGQSEGAALAGAADTAGLIGGNYLAGYIGRQFGLEEARLEADPTTQSPWVVMGTYLSPRLYVRYGVGVYEDAYSIIVRYKLTEHWIVQGEGGRYSGGDIFYTFERP